MSISIIKSFFDTSEMRYQGYRVRSLGTDNRVNCRPQVFICRSRNLKSFALDYSLLHFELQMVIRS